MFHNDDFLLRYNISVPTEDFKKYAFKFPQFFYSFANQWTNAGRMKLNNFYSSWREIYSAPIVLMLSQWGLCYSFNIANASDLFDFTK